MMNADNTHAKGNTNNFFRFLAYVKPYRGYLILAILGGIVKFTVPLLVPELTRYLLDDVFLNPALSKEPRYTIKVEGRERSPSACG